MNHITALRKTGHVAAVSLILGLASAGAQASRAVDHSQGYKTMSMKDDSPPVSGHPLACRLRAAKADLIAHK